MEYTKQALDALTAAFGIPLYLFDERGFSDNFRKLEQAMRAHYDNYRVAYSFKTNYTPFVCKTAKALGAWAEVVSDMEYRIAREIGYEDERIIFNGPGKAEAGAEAMRRGCLVNADSLDEVQALREAALANPEKAFRLGLRVNLDVGQGFVSRFGMDDDDLERALRMIRGTNLRVAGLHCHISRARGLDAWRARTDRMLTLSDRLFEDAPDYLDLGSGMFGDMAPEFAAQFSGVPTYEEYAWVTAGLMAEHFRGKRGPILFTEPGTTLINRYVDCIARVEAIKEISGHYFAVLNVGIHNLGETCTLKRLPVTVVPGGGEQRAYDRIDLTGYTCLEQDIVFSRWSGRLAKGDYVIFGNVGGYSNVLKPPFIRPNCAMAAERADGTMELIKSAETCEDLLHTYRF